MDHSSFPETASLPGSRIADGLREPSVLEAFVVDVNGIARGKWVPADRIPDVMRKGIALPRSVFALDIWGCDVPEAGLAVGTGDPDGICLPVEGSLMPVTWLTRPTHQVLLSMIEQDGTPFYGDPRQVLSRVARECTKAGLTPVMATELEFYLIDKRRTPRDPRLAADVQRGALAGLADAGALHCRAAQF